MPECTKGLKLTKKPPVKKSIIYPPPEFFTFRRDLEFKNVVSYLNHFESGLISLPKVKTIGEYFVTQQIKEFQAVNFNGACYSRRTTSLAWHPTDGNVLAVGSKAGEFAVHNLKLSEPIASFEGIGPGGSILSICYDPFSDNTCYTASIDGTIKRTNYLTKHQDTLLDTQTFEIWYCSVTASRETGLVLAGDTKGRVKILNKDMKLVSEYRLHKNKVNSAEFCPRYGFLLATASLDKTAKLWDIRNLKENNPLSTLDHNYPVNSAYFSRTDASRLLTTDQCQELRIFKGPLWDLQNIIAHPHKQFQHLTPIKGTWHPLVDLIVVGRYPSPKFAGYSPGEPRTVDVISGTTGKMITQMFTPNCKVMSLNVFNCKGTAMATGMGCYLMMWQPPKGQRVPDKGDKPNTGGDESDNEDSDGNDKPPPPKKRAPPKSKLTGKKPVKETKTKKGSKM